MQTAARMQRVPLAPSVGIRAPFRLLGGRLAVDFANAVPGHSAGSTAENWAGLIAFLEQAGVIASERTRELLHMSEADPQAVEHLLRQAVALSEALHRGFDAHIRGEHIERATVEAVNELLRVTEGHDELVPLGREWTLRLIAREQRPEWLLAAVARSAAELIAEGSAAPLRKCANPRCPLFFYDTSRTGRRRWCSMGACGNRSKVASFARRRARDRHPA